MEISTDISTGTRAGTTTDIATDINTDLATTIVTSRDLAENRGWPRRRHQSVTATAPGPATELDCGTCTAPASACSDCVMSVLLQIDPVEGHVPGSTGATSTELTAAEFTAAEWRAVEALSSGGLLPPLRHRAAG